MKAVVLLFVLIVAKMLIVGAHPINIELHAFMAFIWQDLAFVLAYATVDYLFRRRPWIGWFLYSATAIYVSINVPVARMFSTPLTWPMIRATGGPLKDSIVHHLTFGNIVCILVMFVVAAALPLAVQRIRLGPKTSTVAALLAIAMTVAGIFARGRSDTAGLHRNAVLALVTTAFPRNIEPTHRWPGDRPSGQFSDFVPYPADHSLSLLRGTAAKRNVIIISLESTAAAYLKLFGGTNEAMPNVTQLASESLVFENAYAVYPESIKGLFSILTSRYPALDTKPEAYRRCGRSLAEQFSGAGFTTALFHSGRFMYLGMKAIIEDRGFDLLEDAGHIGGNHESSFGIDEHSTVRRMLSWIDSLDQPFFITYLPIAGHHPYNTPEPGPFRETSEFDRYLNSLHYADSAIGELIAGLKNRNLYNQTLFVLYGDHGEAFGQHAGNFGHTFFIYEENVRVPLLIVAPGIIKNTHRIASLASLVDIAPTILDMAGLPVPASFQGRSLIQGRRTIAMFFTDYSQALFGLRVDDWKFTYDVESGHAKLFDLHSDPGETCNLAEVHVERCRTYREHLKAWSRGQRMRIGSAQF